MKKARPVYTERTFSKIKPGNALLFHAVAHEVSSAQVGLTSLFEMGRCGAPPPQSPGNSVMSCDIKISTIEGCVYFFFQSVSIPIKLKSSRTTYQYHSAEHISCAYTCDLSTMSSTWGLQWCRSTGGNLISGWASRLDAFSAYPIRMQLPCCAFGKTTGALWIRPFRSSRTRNSSLQISYAHSRQGPNCLTTF